VLGTARAARAEAVEEIDMTGVNRSAGRPGIAGRVAVVTGAAHGIGAATAERLAADGARVAVCDIRGDAAEEVACKIHKAGGAAAAFMADVADRKTVPDLVTRIEEKLGPIDILHNNAGRMVPGTAIGLELDEWDRTINLNMGSVFLMARYVLPGMRSRKRGAIVNSASMSGMVGEPGLIAYNATKAAIVNMTRQLAADFSRDGVRVNCVCPGWIDTGFNDVLFEGWSDEAIHELVERQVPLGRQGTAEEVADTVAFLCSDEARYITGHALVVDGGLTACCL
jgi:meso-butanediol dehydrogenase/(S,S)-butanediol dehydrogenase/diacetyl reductase